MSAPDDGSRDDAIVQQAAAQLPGFHRGRLTTDASLTLPAYAALAAEAMRRARARLATTPGALDGVDASELEGWLHGAFQQASLAVIADRKVADVVGAERERVLDALVATMLDKLTRSEPDGASFTLDRHSFEQLNSETWRCRPEHIRAAIERADYDDAAIRALGCGALGMTLPSRLIADVLVGVERLDVFLALGRQIGGDDVEPLLELLRRGRFADNPIGLEQVAYATFVLWKLQGAGARAVIAPHLRNLARTLWLPARAVGVVLWLAMQLEDPHVPAIFVAKQHGEVDSALADLVGRFLLELWSMPIDEVIAVLPERAPDPLLAGVPVRAAPKVGRNEACPCGSGKKFKRCCADKPGAAPVSTGPSRVDRLRAMEPRFERAQIVQLSRVDLAQLDLTRLREGTVIDAMRQHVELRDWSRATRAVDELTRRRGVEFADGHLEDVISEALAARQYDAAEALIGRLRDPDAAARQRLELALGARGPDVLATLETAALAALTDEGTTPPIDLAFATLRAAPALGILIARGAFQDRGALDGETLLEAIEEARDALLLPPGDPAQAQFDALGGVREEDRGGADTDAERARLTRTAAELSANLEQAAERLAVLQRQVADRERDLARAERVAGELTQRSPQTAAGEYDRRAQRGKIDELQALIRERNAERADLRRQLADATGGRAETATAEPAGAARRRARLDPDDDDDVEALPVPATRRALLFPQFTAAARAALASVPRDVATVAMRTVAALAAGEVAAWGAVKQAKDMRRQVLMARIGIHHRLLFRTDDDALDVLDVVSRESLFTTLKRLRMA
jgi:hypothetical protein